MRKTDKKETWEYKINERGEKSKGEERLGEERREEKKDRERWGDAGPGQPGRVGGGVRIGKVMQGQIRYSRNGGIEKGRIGGEHKGKEREVNLHRLIRRQQFRDYIAKLPCQF